LTKTPSEEDERVDWIGASLVTAGLVLIVLVLSDAPTARKGWKNPHEYPPVYVRVLFKFIPT